MKVKIGLVVGLGLLLGLSGVVKGEGYRVGCGLWNMLPYADTLILDLQYFDSGPGQTTWLFPSSANWKGLTSYEMKGGGIAIYNMNDAVFTVNVDVRNMDPNFFFDGHPNCRVNMALDQGLNGPWVVECLGKTPPPGVQSVPPFIVRGNAQFVPNGETQFSNCETLQGQQGRQSLNLQTHQSLAGE